MTKKQIPLSLDTDEIELIDQAAEEYSRRNPAPKTNGRPNIRSRWVREVIIQELRRGRESKARALDTSPQAQKMRGNLKAAAIREAQAVRRAMPYSPRESLVLTPDGVLDTSGTMVNKVTGGPALVQLTLDWAPPRQKTQRFNKCEPIT